MWVKILIVAIVAVAVIEQAKGEASQVAEAHQRNEHSDGRGRQYDGTQARATHEQNGGRRYNSRGGGQENEEEEIIDIYNSNPNEFAEVLLKRANGRTVMLIPQRKGRRYDNERDYDDETLRHNQYRDNDDRQGSSSAAASSSSTGEGSSAGTTSSSSSNTGSSATRVSSHSSTAGSSADARSSSSSSNSGVSSSSSVASSSTRVTSVPSDSNISTAEDSENYFDDSDEDGSDEDDSDSSEIESASSSSSSSDSSGSSSSNSSDSSVSSVSSDSSSSSTSQTSTVVKTDNYDSKWLDDSIKSLESQFGDKFRISPVWKDFLKNYVSLIPGVLLALIKHVVSIAKNWPVIVKEVTDRWGQLMKNQKFKDAVAAFAAVVVTLACLINTHLGFLWKWVPDWLVQIIPFKNLAKKLYKYLPIAQIVENLNKYK